MTPTDADIDRLLREPWLTPEPGFTERVLQRTATRPPSPPQEQRPQHQLVQALRWLVIGGGALWGATEVTAFVLGAWTASAAL